jgi:putative peptidoglycan lipid II flippase
VGHKTRFITEGISILRNRPLLWDTITTTFFSSAGKSVAFLVPFFVAAWFGVTVETDAFFFAYGLVIFISGVFAPVVENVIVPYIAEARAKGEDVGRLIGRISGLSGIILLVLTGTVILTIKPFLSITTQFDSQSLQLVYWLLLETSPLIILLIWSSVLAGSLNAYKKFAFPALSPAFRAIIIISSIFIFKDKWGVHSIAWGYIAGELVRLALLVVVIKKLNLFTFGFSFQLDPRLQDFLKNASYQVLGMVAIGLNRFVDTIMASWLGKGSVSVLHYADRLYMIPVTFITTGLMVSLLSHWSSRYYEAGHQRLGEDVKKTVKVTGCLALSITLVLILIHQPMVDLAFGRGAFDHARLSEVGGVLVYYLLGFLPFMLGRVYVRAHLVLKNTKVLMRGAFYLIGLNIVLDFLLMRLLDVGGIALATTFTSLFTLLYLGVIFHKNM